MWLVVYEFNFLSPKKNKGEIKEKKKTENKKKCKKINRKKSRNPKVFIAAGIKSEETFKKWRKNRVQEVTHGLKNMPQGWSSLLGDMFRRSGVPALYSLDAGNDDTMACHAQADGAAILSDHKDFFHYTDATYMVKNSLVKMR